MMDKQRAVGLKEEGNKRFQAGDYKGAEALYTQAINLDPSSPTFYTNRAFARVKLQAWDGVISDCLESIKLQSFNMKAYYYLAQAQMGLHHPSEALSSALTAYDFCQKLGDASIGNISALILRAKKEKWEVRERERIRRRNGLLQELEDKLYTALRQDQRALDALREDGELDAVSAAEESEIAEEVTNRKIDELRSVFALTDPQMAYREVPDYLIDNISFQVMHDPVMTKTGHSYDRATILDHLRRSETDPLTREPLRKEDLRPNIALKQACDKFLEENGWAVDW